jgi:hypothetical protein
MVWHTFCANTYIAIFSTEPYKLSINQGIAQVIKLGINLQEKSAFHSSPAKLDHLLNSTLENQTKI